jgi:aryl-alcohol dehydrogenase-like predicted oxidoreductase
VISGHATAEGTRRFARRFRRRVNGAFFRETEGLMLSTVGIGTSIGALSSRCDRELELAIEFCLEQGINVIDTALCYRAQRSERTIGKVITRLIEADRIARDEIFISTKCGYLPFDHVRPPDGPSTAHHSFNPRLIDQQIQQSLVNLNLETLDLCLLHNPEEKLKVLRRDGFQRIMKRALMELSRQRKAGNTRFYGFSTWELFLTARTTVDLDALLESISGVERKKGFKFIQMPVNRLMPQAALIRNQRGKTVLEKCQERAINVLASASLMQGMAIRSSARLSPASALNQVRSTKGVSIALCGMKKTKHLKENLKIRSMSLTPKCLPMRPPKIRKDDHAET